ncbi:olfactory receptor 10A7-like [Spea bombifrons]|uniref:olfactory receptor 10A7-like n=1 Tax=Spea bombifrons TaxID=233779 RepID=UPI002348FC92|nr:olfactory receptor 10A7-like [Spea bombifrons]
MTIPSVLQQKEYHSSRVSLTDVLKEDSTDLDSLLLFIVIFQLRSKAGKLRRSVNFIGLGLFSTCVTMLLINQTKVAAFLLLGFQNSPVFNQMLFVLFLVLYILTLLGNLMIIMLVARAQSLRFPMYFFLTQLSLSDILLTTNIAPNMLHVIIYGGGTISFTACITQLYFHGTSTAAECLLLTVMSYDRYLAICRPLHYTSIMDLKLQIQLVILCWFTAFPLMLPIVFLIDHLQFCGPQIIDHYFCDLAPLLELSCSDYNIVKVVDIVLGIPSALFPFCFILSTYVYIFIAIFGISSTIGRQKAFSTCSSHLTVVSTFYGTLIAIYLFPSEGQTSTENKLISLLYSVGTPFLNPIIYSLRNQEIRSILLKYISNA